METGTQLVRGHTIVPTATVLIVLSLEMVYANITLQGATLMMATVFDSTLCTQIAPLISPTVLETDIVTRNTILRFAKMMAETVPVSMRAESHF